MMLSAHFDQKSLRVFTDPEARESGQSRDGGGAGGEEKKAILFVELLFSHLNYKEYGSEKYNATFSKFIQLVNISILFGKLKKIHIYF